MRAYGHASVWRMHLGVGRAGDAKAGTSGSEIGGRLIKPHVSRPTLRRSTAAGTPSAKLSHPTA